jgi:hypothetical protein
VCQETGHHPKVRSSLLRGFELTGPAGVVDLPSKKLAGLLTYLACTAPRPQSREKLSAPLWGSHFEVQAKQNLRQALSRLRKVPGEDALKSDGEVVSLNAAAILCDVSQFEIRIREGSRDALSSAADLYRGRQIDDVTVSEEGWNRDGAYHKQSSSIVRGKPSLTQPIMDRRIVPSSFRRKPQSGEF